MMDWNKLITDAHAENSNGIEVRRGKKYTTVAVRVEILRRNFGGVGISTEIVQWAPEKGAPIVVKATVTDEAGRVLSTGFAEEIRGQGQVNSTSALENAETSAIGRALAALGLSGGEFASANEMDGVERKTAAQKEAPKPAEPKKHSQAVQLALDSVPGLTTAEAVNRFWLALRDKDPETANNQAVIDACASRKEKLTAIYPPN